MDRTRRTFLKKLPHLAVGGALATAVALAALRKGDDPDDECAQLPCRDCSAYGACSLPKAQAEWPTSPTTDVRLKRDEK